VSTNILLAIMFFYEGSIGVKTGCAWVAGGDYSEPTKQVWHIEIIMDIYGRGFPASPPIVTEEGPF
jgi:hypothetical protein